MNYQNQNTIEATTQSDTLTSDFVAAAIIVSVLTNITVFVTWLVVALV